MSIHLNLFFLILPVFVAISLVAFFNHNGKPTQVTLMEFQRGHAVGSLAAARYSYPLPNR